MHHYDVHHYKEQDVNENDEIIGSSRMTQHKKMIRNQIVGCLTSFTSPPSTLNCFKMSKQSLIIELACLLDLSQNSDEYLTFPLFIHPSDIYGK